MITSIPAISEALKRCDGQKCRRKNFRYFAKQVYVSVGLKITTGQRTMSMTIHLRQNYFIEQQDDPGAFHPPCPTVV